jgi:hypothetical protein
MKNFFKNVAATLLKHGIDALPDTPNVTISRTDLHRVLHKDHRDYRPYESFVTPMEQIMRFNIMNRIAQTFILPCGGWEGRESCANNPTPYFYPDLVIHSTYRDYRGVVRTGIMIRPGYAHDTIQGAKNPDAMLAAFGLSGSWIDDGHLQVEKLILPVFNGHRQIDGYRAETLRDDIFTAALGFAHVTISQIANGQRPLYFSNFHDAGLSRDRRTLDLSLRAPAP